MMNAREHANGRYTDPPLPRNMAKLVEKRRKERVARSRLIANNQEYQRQLVNTTTAYRREKEIQRLTAYLNTPIPSLWLAAGRTRARAVCVHFMGGRIVSQNAFGRSLTAF